MQDGTRCVLFQKHITHVIVNRIENKEICPYLARMEVLGCGWDTVSLSPLSLLRPCHQGVWDLSMPPSQPFYNITNGRQSFSSDVAIPVFFSTTKMGLYRGRGKGKEFK